MIFNVCVSDQFIDMSFITFFEALHSNMEKTALISPPVKIHSIQMQPSAGAP